MSDPVANNAASTAITAWAAMGISGSAEMVYLTVNTPTAIW